MAKDGSKKEPQFGLELEDVEPEVKFQAAAAREARIGRTAEKILLSHADKKPGNFLSVKFAQEIRKVAEVLHGEKPEAEAKKGELDLEECS